jgi:hypothetical protein
MLIDETLYAWQPSDAEDYAIENEGSVGFGAEGRRIYMLELSGTNKGTVNVYADEEQTELIGSVTYPDVVIEPEQPKCVDMIYVSGDGVECGVVCTIYCEKGIPKVNLDGLLNTTDGMTCIRSTANDDETDTIDGLAGFFFDGVEATNLYVSGNHWIGFGVSSEQLKICRRDGKCYYLYRQDGELGSGIAFLKIRWEGYTNYSSTAKNSRLIFELFLFGNNDMFLNVVQTPTSSSYYGASQLICGDTTTDLSICDGSGGGKQISFFADDLEGESFQIAYESYSNADVYTDAYLIRSEGKYYTVENDVLTEIEVVNPTSAIFYRYGTETIPEGALLLDLVNPEVLFWTNDPTDSLLMKAELTVYPYPQRLLGFADMSSETIKGISLITAEYTGNIGIKLSFDGGASYEEEQTMDEFLAADLESLWNRCEENRSLYISFILYNGAKLTRFKITYVN